MISRCQWKAGTAEARRPPFAAALPPASLKLSRVEGRLDDDRHGWRALLGAALQAEKGVDE